MDCVGVSDLNFCNGRIITMIYRSIQNYFLLYCDWLCQCERFINVIIHMYIGSYMHVLHDEDGRPISS